MDCYNTSQHLGLYTHFTCPDKYVYWRALCRGVSFCVGMIYLILKFGRLAYTRYKTGKESVYSFKHHSVETMLKIYSEHHICGKEEELNVLLLHIFYSKSRAEAREAC